MMIRGINPYDDKNREREHRMEKSIIYTYVYMTGKEKSTTYTYDRKGKFHMITSDKDVGHNIDLLYYVHTYKKDLNLILIP